MEPGLAELASSFTQRRLHVVVADEAVPLHQAALSVLERMLTAALGAGVAEVVVESSAGEDGRLHLALRLRAIDRSVAIDFARRLDLAALRRELEDSGGNLLRAHSRFAVFHLEIAFAAI